MSINPMTLETVNKAIKKLEELDANDEFAYEYALTAFLSIKGIPVIIDDLAAKTAVVRSRTHRQDEIFFNKISEIFIAPQEVVKSFARCNRPFQPKLYSSETRPISYMEIADDWTKSISSGDKVIVTISKWELQRPLKIVIVTSPDKHLRTSYFDKYYGKGFDETVQQYDPESRNATIVLYRFLFERFRKHAKKDLKTYIITTAYCNLALFLAKEQADGIMYPSVPAKEIGLNFAFNQAVSTFEIFKLISVSRNELLATLSPDNKMNYTELGIIHAKNFNTKLDEIIW
ncbi:hypothetical protein QEG73_01075 [Chitinophagaceae bacterium 26-R-25]|nr:hypothetical protein [Chitinophagaceae bacterium 26-R-25]